MIAHGADRFAREMQQRNRRFGITGFFEAFFAVVLIVALGFFAWFLTRQIAQGDFQSENSFNLWRNTGPMLLCLLVLGLLLIRRINIYWSRRLRMAHSDLRQRLALSFAVVGMLPTSVLLILAFAYFSFGFSGWIDRTLQLVLKNQTELAQGYTNELQSRVESDIAGVAKSVSELIVQARARESQISNLLSQNASTGSYWHLYLYDATGTPLRKYGPGSSFDPILPESSFREAANSISQKLNLTLEQDFSLVKVLAAVPDTVPPLFVYGSKQVDSSFVESAESARLARLELTNLESRVRWVFFLISAVLAMVALVLLLAATTIGLWFANRLIEPIGNIIAAASEMGEGSLDVRVPVSVRQFAEFRALSNSFNIMAGRLEQQQADVLEANSELDERRQFTSAVLAGVSAGVIGLNEDLELTLPNASASELLGLELDKHIGGDLRILLPEFSNLLARAKSERSMVRSEEIKMFHKSSGSLLILLASAIAERVGNDTVGYVLTFDDVTELASAQRQSAWSEVARRIAHEIKNPLTPIQLSTERLKRRFGEKIAEDEQDVFNLCVDTIGRQVETISRLVSEFSSFSRMPTATLAKMDVTEICRQAFFLQSSGFEGQDWEITIPETSVFINGDQTLLNQALQNLLKNAGEAMGQNGDMPKVTLALQVAVDGSIIIGVEDNGDGIPEHLLDKIGEPYVSTKQEGTGLGLAIVKKIVEDHAGTFSVSNREAGGARVQLTFPSFDPEG